MLRYLNKLAFQDFALQRAKAFYRRLRQRAYRELAEQVRSFYGPDHSGHYPDALILPQSPKILIFKPDDIGDAVYAMPALQTLKQSYPDAKLYLLCQKKTAPLYERLGVFEQIVAVEVQTRWLRFLRLDLNSALKRFSVSHFDCAVFLKVYAHLFKAFLKVPATVHVHPRDPLMPSVSAFQAWVSLWSRPRAHQGVLLQQIIARVTNRPFDAPSDLNRLVFPAAQWNEEDRRCMDKAFGTQTPPRYVVVHPFNRYETKRYPLASWAIVLDHLKRALGVELVVVGGKEDGDFPIPGVLSLQGKLSLGQTGYLLSKAAGFVGIESGPAHWAAALGVPTFCIFGGHSLLEEWRPLGNVFIAKHSVPCEGCHRRACPRFRVRCLSELDPGLVARQVVGFFTKSQR